MRAASLPDREALARAPLWARWVAAYLVLLLLAALLAVLPWLDLGGAMFLLGALGVLVAAFLLRTGGERRVVTLRAPDGTPLRREPVDPERRAREVRLGVFLFLLGLALWAPLAAMAFRG